MFTRCLRFLTDNNLFLLLLKDFSVVLQAFANMTLNVRKALCAVMVFAVVEKANSVVMDNGEEVCQDIG